MSKIIDWLLAIVLQFLLFGLAARVLSLVVGWVLSAELGTVAAILREFPHVG